MLSARGVLRREKGKRDLIPTGRTLEEKLQDIQSVQIPPIDPLESRITKYRKVQEALSLLDEKLAKARFYANSFESRRSDPASQASVAQFNALQKNIESLRSAYQKQKEKLEPSILESEHKQGFLSLQDYLQQQEAEKESLKALQQEAKTLYRQRGALCDSEGFYQHYAECWSDSIQQLFLNADGIKEETQRQMILYPDLNTSSLPDLLFTLVFNPLRLRDAKKKEIEALSQSSRDVIQLQKQWVSLYFHEVKKRFFRHYLTEGKRRELLETCSLREPIANVAKKQLADLSKLARQQGKQGVSAAIFGKLGIVNTNKPNYKQFQGLAAVSPELYSQPNSFSQGGTFIEIIILLNLFNYIFFSNTLEFRFVDYDSEGFVNGGPGEPRMKILTPESFFLPTARGILASSTYYDEEGKEKFGHLIAFYTCGGKDFLFDNENGIIPCDYRKLFSLYFEKISQKPFLTFCSFLKEDASQKYSTSMYPVLAFPSSIPNSPPSYATVLDGTVVEFPQFPFTQGSTQLFLEDNVIFDYLVVVSQPEAPRLENTGYTFQSEARLGRLKEQDLKPFIAAVSQPNDEREALKQLALLDSPPLDLTVLTPKTAIPYPLVYLAVRLNWIRFLMALLRKGYDPNSKLTEGPRKGITALMQAVTAGKEDAVKILLDAKADPNLADEKGFRAIHNAVLQKNLPLLQLLVEAGADLNVQTYTGATPLYFAASSDEPAIVEYLCKKGADPKIKGAALPKDPKILPVMAAKTFPSKSLLMRCQLLKGGTRRRRQAKRKTRRRN